MKFGRRSFLQIGTGIVLASAGNSCTQSNQSPSARTAQAIKVGFWPIAAGLPLYLAVDKGYFKEAGLDVEAINFAGAQQVVEGILAGRIDGSANGVGSGNLAIGEIASPGLFKIIATNPSNVENVLDQIIVGKDSKIQAIAELQGQKVCCGPGPQNEALAKGILEKNGIENPQVSQLDIKQHVAAIESGQYAAAYTLEPTGTVGSMAGITRILEAGVISKYILNEPNAPWCGGSAAISTKLIQQNPQLAKQYIDVYRRGVESIRNDPEEARQYLAGYTAIKGELAKEVPLPAYLMYDEFTPADISYFQKFFDFMQEKKVFSRKLEVEPLILTASDLA